MEELEHEQQLAAMYTISFDDVPIETQAPVELRRYVDGLDALKEHFFVTDSTTADALLRIAEKIERFTAHFYERLAAETTEPELRAVYAALAEFEKDHEQQFAQRRG